MAWASLETVLRVGTALELLKRSWLGEERRGRRRAPDEVKRRRKGARAGRRWAWSDLGCWGEAGWRGVGLRQKKVRGGQRREKK